MCSHKLRFSRQSMIYHNGKYIVIDIYICDVCHKYRIVNNDTCTAISLDGKLGEEVEL